MNGAVNKWFSTNRKTGVTRTSHEQRSSFLKQKHKLCYYSFLLRPIIDEAALEPTREHASVRSSDIRVIYAYNPKKTRHSLDG